MVCGAAKRSTNEEEIRPGSHSTQKKRNTNAIKCTEYRESEAIPTQTNSCKTNTEKKGCECRDKFQDTHRYTYYA